MMMVATKMALVALLSNSVRYASAFAPSPFANRVARAAVARNQLQWEGQVVRSMSAVADETKEATTGSATETAGAKAKEELMILPTSDEDSELMAIRKSSGLVLAMAVKQLFDDAQVTLGPVTENGFHYDFFFPETKNDETGEMESRKLTDQDLKAIKKAMDKIIGNNLPITTEEVSREDAEAMVKEANQPFLTEILEGVDGDVVTICKVGDDFWTIVDGEQVESTGKIPKKALQLQSVAGAYWKGDESREMLQRVYGTAWKDPTQLKASMSFLKALRVYGTAWKDPTQLKAFKKLMEEAKKRDHRILGQNLDLFSIQEDAGGGLVFWHPKGSAIRKQIEDFWKQAHIDGGYDLIYTPHIANLDLWKTSGHFDFYKDDMFDQMAVDEEQFQIKPMNCPFHCLMYKDTLRSYRDLPIRWGELGTVYRYERSGTLHGLMRVRGFTQDDGHIFCLPEQLQDEIVDVLTLIETILSRFGFTKYEVMLSTRPDKSVGSDEIWEKATNALEGALQAKEWDYSINEGDGAFYGPKIDFKIRDAIGRSWQCSTVQCDFNLPERFGLEYISAENNKERPIMVHRAVFGSVERFFGILVEDTKGDFPLWLAPTQLRLLPVTDAVQDYCHEVAAKARKLGIRVEVDRGTERLAKQIRNAEKGRIPIMAVVGMKEMETNTLAVRSRKEGDLGQFGVDGLLGELVRCVDAAEEMTMMGEKEEEQPEIVEVEAE